MRRILSLLTLLCFCISMSATIYIGGQILRDGKSITSDVVTSGKVSLSGKTLTLDNATITSDANSVILIQNELSTITIKLIGSNNINATKMHGITLTSPVEIIGTNSSSTLDINVYSTTSYSAISVQQTDLGIYNCIINATSENGPAIAGHYSIASTTNPGTSSLYIENAQIHAKGAKYAIINFKSFRKYWCDFADSGYSYDTYTGCILNSSKQIASEVTISRLSYPIKIAGTSVTYANRNDVLGDGTVKAEADDNGDCNLYLKNANITTTSEGISIGSSLTKDVYITTEGSNSITSTNDNAIYATHKGGLTIDGKGSLSLKSEANRTTQGFNHAVLLTSSPTHLCIDGRSGCTLSVFSKNGKALFIDGNATYEFDEASVSFSCGSSTQPAICSQTAPSFVNCYMDQMNGQKWDATTNNIVDYAGNSVSSVYVKHGYGISIDGEELTKDHPTLSNNKAWFEPSSNTLVLDNIELSGLYAQPIFTCRKDLNIELRGTNKLSASSSRSPILMANAGTVTFRNYNNGTPSIDLNALSYNPAIKTYNTNIIIGTNVTFTAKSQKADCLAIDGKLTIYKANVTAATSGMYSSYWSIRAKDLVLNNSEFEDYSLIAYNGTAWHEESGKAASSEVKITPSEYNIWVAGVQVCKENSENITGEGISGRVYYDRPNRTLYLNEAEITPDDTYLGILTKEKLTIRLIGENTIYARNAALYSQYHDGTNALTILGNGFGSSLTVTSTGAFGVAASRGICIEDCSLTAKGKTFGIVGNSTDPANTLWIQNAKVRATGTDGGSISDFMDIKLYDNEKIITPSATTIGEINGQQSVVYDNDGTMVKNEEVFIAPYTTYDIMVCGKIISSINCSDVLGDGTISYLPDEKMLILNNTNITPNKYQAIYSLIDGLTIYVVGSNIINTGSAIGLYLRKNTTIIGEEGSGLSILNETSTTVFACADLTIQDCAVSIMNYQGGALMGPSPTNSTLTLRNVTLVAYGYQYGSISGWRDIQLEDCEVTSPDDIHLELSDAPYGYCDESGEAYCGTITIEPKTTITIEDITNIIDRYLSGDAGITIESITSLIDKYLAQ